MNNLGFSNDNLHIGDVRIKGQNETLRIGNENGGDGYILPTEKGTVGQVITMNADNSTSFQDAPTPPGLTGRIVKNLFVMRERTSFYNTLPTSAQALFQTGYGSNDVLIGDFPVNSTIHIYSRGVISFDASVVSSGTGVFQLEIDDGAGSVVYFTSNNLTLSKQGTANQNRFYHLDFIFQRTGTNTYRVDGYGLASDGSNGQIKMGFVETSYSPVTPYTQFTIKATYYKIVSTPNEEYIPLAQVYINDLILDTSLLISPPPAPTSHTALTDLTAGDAGHTQFALLQGRSGGQLLSGGINASHFLTLKAHRFGLNNIIVKDLNTSFQKDIDMNNNSLLNGFGLNTQFLLASSQIETSQIISVGLGQQNYVANPHIFTADGTPATQQLEINNVELSAFKPLNMNNGSINNVSSINSFTPQGGVYSGTSDGIVINNTTEQSVLPASGVGSLTIPANAFSVGDCFHCVVAGDCSFDKDDNIQIKLKENGNILAQTPIFNLEDAQAGDNAFEIEIDFTIRSIGASGSIATNFDFTYNKDGTDSKDFRGTRAMDVQTIDTTVTSTLDITVQFPTNITPSTLQTRLFRLQKVF